VIIVIITPEASNCLSARCATAANILSMDSGLFNDRFLLVSKLIYEGDLKRNAHVGYAA